MSDLEQDRADGAVGSAAPSRRTVLRGVGAATLGAVAVGAFAACGSGGGGVAPGASAGSGGGAAPGASAGSGGLAKVADIPVGGAISAVSPDGKPIILAQPTKGTIVGMSAICTHLGCTVAPDGAKLVCPCHGSVYKAADGSNVSGPAPRPLAAVAVRVANGEVFAG